MAIYKITEAAPSKFVKVKDTSRDVTNSYFAGDIYDSHSGMYQQTDRYGGSYKEGYITDKEGNKYSLIASYSTGDAGRIAGGSQSYSVTIDYNGTAIKWSGYTAVFSSSYNTGMLIDIAEGIYLEDFCAKYPNHVNEHELVAELAVKGNANADSYNYIQAQKREERFNKRYLDIPKYINLVVTTNGIVYSDNNPLEIINDTTLPAMVADILQNQLFINGYTINDFADAQIKILTGYDVLYDTKYNKYVGGGTNYSKNRKEIKKDTEISLHIGSDPKYYALHMYAFDIKDCAILELVQKIIKKSRRSIRQQTTKDDADRIFRHNMPYWGYERGTAGIARRDSKYKAEKDFDSYTETLLKGILTAKELFDYVKDLPKREVLEIAQDASVAEPAAINSVSKQASSKSYPSAYYTKMTAWHNGERKQNIKACSDAKLLAYYNICNEMGYTDQSAQLLDEIEARHLTIDESVTKFKNLKINFDETINSSEPAYDEIQAMRDEENEKAKRKERFQLMHKVFDKHGLVNSDEKWTSDLYDLFYYAEEIRLVSNLNSIPNKTEEGQTIKYRWSIDDISIYTDAYADYVYILEPAQLTEGFRYNGTDKTSEKLTMDALNELETNPGEVYNYKKFDIFYGENKDHFPFNPCYYIKFRPSGYTSMMFSKEHCLKYINDNKLDESVLIEGRLNGSYDKTQLENDLLALNDIDKVDWDLSAYDELGEVIVLTHRAFEDSVDMSAYYMQRTNLLREILKVFDKNNLKLVDPIEDQGTWWYFVLEHKNSVESSDKPQLEYVMVEFFETSGTPADDIMRRTKGVKYADLSKLSELLVNADKIFREVDEYGGYNKVYFDNYIRYQGKLYKFHAGRVDIGDGPAEVSIPTNYSEQVTSYFLSELNSGNNTIPVVED